MEGHNSRFNCIQFDQAIEFILTLIAAGGKLEGTSVSFDASNVSDADSIAVGKASVQAIIEEIIKKGVRSIDIIQSETGPKLRYNKLDGDYKDVALPTADQIRYLSSPTALKTAGAALTDLYNKVAELQRGGVTTEQIQQAIQDWLDAHPEATTSVPDGSITLAKLATEVKTAIDNAGKIASVEVSCNIEERAEEYINYELNINAKDKDGKVVSSRYGFLLIPVVSEDGAGLMTEAMLQTLDRLESSATIDVTVVSNASDVKIKRSVVHGPAKEFSLPAATPEHAGVMTAEDKSKLESAVLKTEDLSRISESIRQEQNAIKAGLQEASSEEALNARVAVVERGMGDISLLETEAKDNLVDAINESAVRTCMSADARQILVQILKAGVYSSDQAPAISRLEEELKKGGSGSGIAMPVIAQDENILTITHEDTSAIIYYTIDESNPKTSLTRQEYSDAIELEKDVIVLAYAVVGGKQSAVTPPFSFVVPEVPYIVFEDDKVRELCVAAGWNQDGMTYKDGTPTLSKADAARVSSLGATFTGNTEIEYFDELKYFTGLKNVEGQPFINGIVFKNCTKLKYLTIPSTSIEYAQDKYKIGDEVFYKCTGLGKVVFKDGAQIVNIGVRCFVDCVFSELLLPSSCSLIQENGITRATRLATINLENVKTFENSALTGCSSLTRIALRNVKSIGANAFKDCGLDSVIYDKSLTTEDDIPVLVNINAFLNKNGTYPTIYVADLQTKSLFENAENWSALTIDLISNLPTE